MLSPAELVEHPFFAGLAPELTARLGSCAGLVTFPADRGLLAEGEPANSMYALTKGRVAVGVRSPHRGFQVIDTVQRGEVLGWSWMFEPYRWTFDAVTVKPVEAIEIRVDCVRPYLTEHPRAAYQLLDRVAAVMAERLHSARLRLVDMFGPPHDD